MDAWNPRQYQLFERERALPFEDLMALCAPVESVIDLGCGNGKLTAQLYQRLGARRGLGVDSSASMLENAPRGNGLDFQQLDLAAWQPDQQWQLVFSNAALQWLPDHDQLFPRLWQAVAPGGQLAVQMPMNHDHDYHRIANQVAAETPALQGYQRQSPTLSPENYALLLASLQPAEQRVRLEVYLHTLADREALVEWARGTLLTDYQKRLSEADFAAFLERYRERLFASVPDRRPYLLTFPRILLWAAKAAE